VHKSRPSSNVKVKGQGHQGQTGFAGGKISACCLVVYLYWFISQTCTYLFVHRKQLHVPSNYRMLARTWLSKRALLLLAEDSQPFYLKPFDREIHIDGLSPCRRATK